jgi:hypothetical protein
MEGFTMRNGLILALAVVALVVGVMIFLITLPDSDGSPAVKLLVRGISLGVALTGYVVLRLKRGVHAQ